MNLREQKGFAGSDIIISVIILFIFAAQSTKIYVHFFLLKRTKDKNLYTFFPQQHRLQSIPYCITIFYPENIPDIYTFFRNVHHNTLIMSKI